MATLIWTGNAPAVAQVQDYVFAGTWEATDVITLTIGTVTVSTTAGSTTITTIIDSLVTTWNNLSSTVYPMFAEITASRSSTTFRLTGDTAGKPFACTIATTETGGGAADAQTIDGAASSTGTESTTCSGPNHWSATANWSTSAIPVDGDDVYIERSSVDIKYGLSQTSIDLTSLNIAASYTGKIGLPDYNSDGTSYYEYRTKYLMLGTATTANIGRGEGSGSGRLKIHLGSNAATVNVEGTGPGVETGVPALLLQGSHASNVLNATQGSIGLAFETGSTAQFPTVRIGSETNPASDVTLVCGAGCTLGGTISQAGGNVTAQTAVTTWTKTAGSTSTILGTATITTLQQDGSGTHYQQSSGTITTATFRGEGAKLDKSRDLRALTITNSTFTAGGHIIDPNKTVTFTNAMTTDQASLQRHVLGLAPFSLQRT